MVFNWLPPKVICLEKFDYLDTKYIMHTIIIMCT